VNINLYKNYYLKSDPMNYILYQKKMIDDPESKNKGNEYEQVEGYFTTIENAINAVCRKEMRACKCTTLNGLIREVKVLQKMVVGLCSEIGADKIVKNVLLEYKDKDKLLEEKFVVEEPPKKKRGRPKKKK